MARFSTGRLTLKSRLLWGVGCVLAFGMIDTPIAIYGGGTLMAVLLVLYIADHG
jgi:uncharacterized membrane protein